ncbi:sphingomyelin phosphodiesterase [Pluteus cervinus]|uniref:Sphingomyelin phosphodiesterase n=1 Tax=Pluteus cervinus TaxID=181527 RepID=A0ACD3B3W1_9AGAR|nr:sphingomyelin phosphodiesterase [Pluteus cervinus]
MARVPLFRFLSTLPLVFFLWTVALNSGVNAGLVDSITRAITRALQRGNCASCHELLITLKGLAALGDERFTKTLQGVCKKLNLEDDDVCEGTLAQQGPILAHVLRKMSPFGQTSVKFCDAVFGLCQSPPVNDWDVVFPKPLPANPKRFERTGKPPIQVVHFSDVHIDRSYLPGSEAKCNKPICCRNFTENGDSEEPIPIIEPAGPFGHPKCDAPVKLLHSFLKEIDESGASFSIFTGDVISGAGVAHDMKMFDEDVQAIIGSMPIYPVIGSESAPVNAFPRDTAEEDNQWVFDTQAEGWKPWIGQAGSDQVKHISGSYSVVHPGTNLRIISINTGYWYKHNFWLYDSNELQYDPNGILEFVVQELQTAEDEGQRAWIIAHMAPGHVDAMSDQSNYFDQIMQRYQNTIAGQFYGHSHHDEFAIAYSNYTNRSEATAMNVGLIAPSLTPRSGQPAFKLYDVDPDTYEILDVHVYSANYTDPSFQREPQWNLHYSVRDAYGSVTGLQADDVLGPAFWHRLTEAFEEDDDLFNLFLLRKNRVPPKVDEVCDEGCKNSTICGLRALRAENNCRISRPGLGWRRRGRPKDDFSIGVSQQDFGTYRVAQQQVFEEPSNGIYNSRILRAIQMLRDYNT